MNTDLTRNTPHAYAERNFISDFNITVCIDARDAQVPHTYVSPNSLTSRIYNCLTTANLGKKVFECAIIDNLLFSDHVPFKVRFGINVDHIFESNYCRKLAWHKASTEHINQYSSDSEHKLSMLQYDAEALLCKNLICKKHDNELSRIYKDILNMCIESSECVPTTYPKNNLNSGGGRRKLPGWSKEVEHLKQEAIFWHRQWRAVGKPHQGDITEMRRITRARYHRAVRHIMREDDRNRTTKILLLRWLKPLAKTETGTCGLGWAG